MFKGKIVSYQNINGKEKRFEKDFDDYNEYEKFIGSHPEFSKGFNYSRFGFPHFNLGGFDEFDNYLNNFFDSKLALKGLEEPQLMHEFDSSINFDKYDKEAKKIDDSKKKSENQKIMLNKTKEKLKGYLEKFKNEKRDDLVKEIEKDIKKVDEKLKKL